MLVAPPLLQVALSDNNEHIEPKIFMCPNIVVPHSHVGLFLLIETKQLDKHAIVANEEFHFGRNFLCVVFHCYKKIEQKLWEIFHKCIHTNTYTSDSIYVYLLFLIQSCVVT